MKGTKAKSKLNLRLASDQLAVQEIERRKSAGGIIIPDTAEKDRTLRCVVLALGPGSLHLATSGKRYRVPISDETGQPIKVGDTILCSKFTHTHEIDGVGKVRILKAEQVIAVEG